MTYEDKLYWLEDIRVTLMQQDGLTDQEEMVECISEVIEDVARLRDFER